MGTPRLLSRRAGTAAGLGVENVAGAGECTLQDVCNGHNSHPTFELRMQLALG